MYHPFRRSIIRLALSVVSLFLAGAVAAAPLSSQQLATSIEQNLKRVDEFRFLDELGKKKNVRIWIFGGFATSYAHYVKGDLQSVNKAAGYDLTDITTLSQDLDVVVDGTAEQAHEIEAELRSKFPLYQGEKPAWEVRPLRVAAPPKDALLDNPHFLNQHSDSASNGLIELTEPPAGEQRIRDLRNMSSSQPEFLKDVAAGKIRYYFSKKHQTTRYFRERRNPEIFSVIRYLTKL